MDTCWNYPTRKYEQLSLVSQADALGKEIKLGSNYQLNCVNKFCYIGDIIGSGAGAEHISKAIVHSTLEKFRELIPILTVQGASLVIKV